MTLSIITTENSVNSHNWDDPDWTLLDDRRGDLPEFPLDIFSPPWQQWLQRASLGAGVRPEHVALPLLGVSSSLIGTARRVRASNPWSEPTTLWTAIVGDSGDRKTPGLNIITRALDLLAKANSDATKAKRLAHEARVQKSKETLRKWKDEVRAAVRAQPCRETPSMPIEALDPGNFIEPQLYTTDSTIERLAELLVVKPRGVLLIRDELSGLFSNMRRYSGGSDRPFWLEAWNGRRHVVERVSRTIVVQYLLIGLVGCFQPDKLVRAFGGDEDGMHARFLFGWPSAPAYRPLTNDTAEVDPELLSALTALVSLPCEDMDGAFASRTIALSKDAIASFEKFRIWIDETKRTLDGRERQWCVKGETMVLRLAGTLAYLAWSFDLGAPSSRGLQGINGAMEPEIVEGPFMTAAIRLWRDYFWPHARSTLRQIGLSDRHREARRALRWIKAKGMRQVSREDVRRDALGQKQDAEQTQQVIATLEKAGWMHKETMPTAGRPIHRWNVNPKLFD